MPRKAKTVTTEANTQSDVLENQLTFVPEPVATADPVIAETPAEPAAEPIQKKSRKPREKKAAKEARKAEKAEGGGAVGWMKSHKIAGIIILILLWFPIWKAYYRNNNKNYYK